MFVSLVADMRTRGVHGDGILVPSPPIPADFTSIPTRPRRFFVTERKAVITVTVVAKLVIY